MAKAASQAGNMPMQSDIEMRGKCRSRSLKVVPFSSWILTLSILMAIFQVDLG